MEKEKKNKNIEFDHSPLFHLGTGENKRIGILLCHGFTGSPHSMRPWAQHLIKQGYTVSMPLLPGHGTHWKDLGKVKWHDWLQDVKEEIYTLNDRCDIVFAIGLSMGGAIVLKTAAEGLVDGAIVVNPGLIIEDPRRHVSGIMRYVLRSVPAIGSDIKKPGVSEGAYPKVSVKAAHQLKKLFHQVRKSLHEIEIPVLLFRSSQDHVVSEQHMKVLRKKLPSKYLETVNLYDSYHVATLDYDAEKMFHNADQFIKSIVENIQTR